MRPGVECAGVVAVGRPNAHVEVDGVASGGLHSPAGRLDGVAAGGLHSPTGRLGGVAAWGLFSAVEASLPRCGSKWPPDGAPTNQAPRTRIPSATLPRDERCFFSSEGWLLQQTSKACTVL